VHDIATVRGFDPVDAKEAIIALKQLDVDTNGLDALDRRYLGIIAEHYSGGPVGIEALAATLGEQRDVIEDVVEPYLVQQGLIQRTPRGRSLSGRGYEAVGLPAAQKPTDTLL
jgi:Holliday junction DNA helicase RuvB